MAEKDIDLNPFADDDDKKTAPAASKEKASAVKAGDGEAPAAPAAKPEPKPKAARKPRAAAKPKEKRALRDIPHSALPLNAESGNVQGVIKVHNGQAIAQIGLKFWVGEIPLSVLADELSDIENVVAELRKQADGIK